MNPINGNKNWNTIQLILAKADFWLLKTLIEPIIKKSKCDPEAIKIVRIPVVKSFNMPGVRITII